MDADLSKQKAEDFFMKLQSEWKIFRYPTMSKKGWSHHLKFTPPRHQLTCICLICLYIFHKLLHKNSHVSPAGFFLGWIWLKTEDVGKARKIMEKLWANEKPSIRKLIGYKGPGKADDFEKLSRNANRNAKYVIEVLEFKKKYATLLKNFFSITVLRLGACHEHDLECQKHDREIQKNLYRFIRRFSRFAIKTRWEFSRTYLLRKFSDKNLIGIVGLLDQCREGVRLLSPEFRYPVKWVDDLASEYEAIRSAECVQAFEKALEIPKEVERTKGTGSDRI